MAVPRQIGSFEDKKFREALAELLQRADVPLFNVAGSFSSASIGTQVLITSSKSIGLLSNVGDTVSFEVYGKFNNDAATKAIGVDLVDEAGASLGGFSILAGYAAASWNFSLQAKIYLTTGKLVSAFGRCFIDNGGAPGPYTIVSGGSFSGSTAGTKKVTARVLVNTSAFGSNIIVHHASAVLQKALTFDVT